MTKARSRMDSGLNEQIAKSIADLDGSEKVGGLVHEALDKGIQARDIIENGLRKGIDSVGRKYEAGEYFLSELIFAGKLMNDALEILKPHLSLQNSEHREIIVLGTIKGDIHDIGKNIFGMLAEASGFEVHDLGVDVKPEDFIATLKQTKARILGLSSLLTTTMREMKNVVELMAPQRTQRVLLGGNAVTKDFAREIGADDAALSAVEGVEICKKWTAKEHA